MVNSNIIRKAVISESIKKEEKRIEKDIIKKRLLFSINESRNKQKSLISESKELIKLGYDKDLVSNIFNELRRFYL
jgi:hypothetical protein